MEAQQVAAQFLQLSAEAQRIVADLITYLERHEADSTSQVVPSADEPVGAIVLPPLSPDGVPTDWPENPFADPAFSGGWADRADIQDSTEFVRDLRRTQWGSA